jgi:hypothetical protein
MASEYDRPSSEPDKKAPVKEEDILKDARQKWDIALEREQHNIKAAYDDLSFKTGDDYSQWPAKQRKERDDRGRPVVQINELPKFIHQITGDIRQMKPSIKVVPVDSGSDEKVASIYGGLIRYIENRSDASAIYFRAADSQVACGIGHWRVDTEYADGSTFNQEIRIGPIEDGVSVLWDPDAVLPTKEDAEFCFVPVDMSRKAFERKYPDIIPNEFDDANWSQNKDWVTDDFVRIAEFWLKKPHKRKLALMPDGSIDDITEADESAEAFARAKQARVEIRESYKVCRYLITASDILEGPIDWPGRFIPIVPLVGEETRIGRKIIRNGIVRNAKDGQRLVNYFHAMHAETIALQPKAPYMVTEVNVAKYQDLWETANTDNQPYLVFTPDRENAGAAPQRIAPPVSSQGVLEGLAIATQSLKDVIGIYDAGLGEKSNETSGKAIIARQREGDTGSMLYVDNFARAIRHTGNICADLIPHVYDTERTIRIMGEDGKIDIMEINKVQGVGPDGSSQYQNDVTVGSYDVVATVGPSYTTRREEAKEGMIAFTQANPAVAPLITDLVAKAQDWPMADDIAKRVRATLPPNIVAMEEAEKQGMDPEQARKAVEQSMQPPPDPKMVEVQARIENDGQRLQLDQQTAAISAEQQQAKQVADQQNAEAQRELEMAKLSETGRQADAKLAAEIMLKREEMAMQERLAIRTAEIAAEVKLHDAAVRAETAKYATDNKPAPSNGAGK